MKLLFLFFVLVILVSLHGVEAAKKQKGCLVNKTLYKKNKIFYKNKKKCVKLKCMKEIIKGKVQYNLRTLPYKNCICKTKACENRCPLELKPVCGQNKEWFENECFFDNARCFDPDLKLARSPNRCATCPSWSCDDHYLPICGTDGIIYDNICHFQKAACVTSGLEMATDQSSCFECRDDLFCLTDYKPVCGSNNVTYSNPCELNKATCANPEVTLALKPHETCKELCPLCPTLIDPVCGSDGNTYINECNLMAQVKPCGNNNNLRILSYMPCVGECKYSCSDDTKRDICGSNGTWFTSLCQFYKGACQQFNIKYDLFESPDAATTCGDKCPDCGVSLYAPVCGSNGRTYHNECELKNEAMPCGALEIQVVSNGPCAGDCNKVCGPELDLRCSNKGKLYRNLCEMQNDACEDPSIIEAADPNLCPKDCPSSCDNIYDPVCGNNGITYDNLCSFKQVTFPCGQIDAEVQDNGICPGDCTGAGGCPSSPTDTQVCGSNGVIYANLCLLKAAICGNPLIHQASDFTVCQGAGKRKRDVMENIKTRSKKLVNRPKQSGPNGKVRSNLGDNKTQNKKGNGINNLNKVQDKKLVKSLTNGINGNKMEKKVKQNKSEEKLRTLKKSETDSNKSQTKKTSKTETKSKKTKEIESDSRQVESKAPKRCIFNNKKYFINEKIKNLDSYCLQIMCRSAKNGKPTIEFDPLEVTPGQMCECEKIPKP